MYGGSGDGSSCDSPGESLSELDLSEDGPVFSPNGSPIILPPTPPSRPSNSMSSRRLFADTSCRAAESVSTLVQRSFSSRLKRTPLVSHQSQSELSQPGTMHNQMEAILQELRKANSRLSDVTNRLDVSEGRLKGLEEISTSPSSDTSTVKKSKVPPQVRYLVRDIYKTQVELSDRFAGFNLKKHYTDPENQNVVKTLIDETQAQDGSIPVIQIRDSVRRFFQSKLEDSALKAKGTYDLKVQKQRRKNRIVKKLESRRAALERTSALSDEQKTKWREVLVSSFISSEESGEEVIDGETCQYLYVKSLPWREAKVNRFMRQMDEKVKKRQSKCAKRQTLPRKPGAVSTRPKPTADFGSTFWAFV